MKHKPDDRILTGNYFDKDLNKNAPKYFQLAYCEYLPVLAFYYLKFGMLDLLDWH